MRYARAYELRDIAGLPPVTSPDHLEDIIESGYQSLTALAMAEATGVAPPAARRVLESPRHCERWVDALLSVRANLSSSLAFRYLNLRDQGTENDVTYQRLTRSRMQVVTRLTDARNRVKSVRREIDERRRRAMVRPPVPDPAADNLIAAQPDRYNEIIKGILLKTGVPGEVLNPPPGATCDPSWGLRTGLLNEAKTVKALALLNSDEEVFRDYTAEDVRVPGGAEPALREALVLPRWGAALDDLAEDSLRALGLPDSCLDGIPFQAWLELPGDTLAAQARINRLRFTEAVLQRRFEREGLMQAVAREIGYSRIRTENNIKSRARITLVNEFPDEYAIYASLLT